MFCGQVTGPIPDLPTIKEIIDLKIVEAEAALGGAGGLTVV